MLRARDEMDWRKSERARRRGEAMVCWRKKCEEWSGDCCGRRNERRSDRSDKTK